jgi:hypothetical protein
MRYASRVDKSHGPIRDGLREAGFSVVEVRGDFDLVAGKCGEDLLIECKTKGNVRSNSATGRRQKRLREDWKGSGIITAFSIEDVLWAFSMRLKRKGWVK